MTTANLIVLLENVLQCGDCEGVLIQVNDPALLLVNVGQPIESLKTFVRGIVEGFEKVQKPNTCEIWNQYTISYDDAVLLDPSQQLRDCDVKRICCADCVIDYIDELLS